MHKTTTERNKQSTISLESHKREKREEAAPTCYALLLSEKCPFWLKKTASAVAVW